MPEQQTDKDLNMVLAKSRDRVCKHLNEDHADSLLAYALWYGKVEGAEAATVTDLTADGFVLSVRVCSGGTCSVRKGVLVPYSTPLASAADVRKVSVAMHFEAHNSLGCCYKIKSGFFMNAARQGVKQAVARTPGGAKAWGGALLAVAVGVYGYFKG